MLGRFHRVVEIFAGSKQSLLQTSIVEPETVGEMVSILGN